MPNDIYLNYKYKLNINHQLTFGTIKMQCQNENFSQNENYFYSTQSL
jgi:hypothetical protein